MKFIPRIFSLVVLSFLFSCKAYSPALNEASYELINLTYSGKEKLYYRTLKEPEIETSIEKINIELWNNNLSKGLVTGGRVDYKNIFSKEDLHFIADQLERQEQTKLDPNLLREAEVLTKKKARGVHQISQPVFNKTRTFGLIFRNKISGGEDIVVYEKVDNEWRVHSVITLSMV